MAVMDVNLLFFHTGNVFAFTSGEYVSLVGNTSISSSCTSSVINLGVQEDMGMGDGEFVPKVQLNIGTAITSSCTSLLLNFQFQGSSDSVTWNLYDETGWEPTSSFGANTMVPMQLPRRLVGMVLPQYYRIQIAAMAQITGSAWITTVGLSTGTIIGGIVLQRPDADDTFGKYPAGFSVA